MGVRHIAVFRFREQTGPADIAGIDDALGALPGQISEIDAYNFGTDLDITDGAWDYAVVADFADKGAFEKYRSHPAHVAAIERSIAGHIAERASVQIAL